MMLTVVLNIEASMDYVYLVITIIQNLIIKTMMLKNEKGPSHARHDEPFGSRL